MNERDSEALSCLLQAHGYHRVSCEDAADVLIFNTCSVREKAEEKVIGKVGMLRRRKRQGKAPVIGIVGCMAQHLGGTLLQSLEHVDFVAGTDRLHQVPHILEEVYAGRGPVVEVAAGDDHINLPMGHDTGRISAYVSVMRGCNQFCSYCIVPYVRGREKSRPIPDILEEVKSLVDSGVREITLLGQSITGYGVVEKRHGHADFLQCGERPFADLLQAVNEVSGLERIRFTSPHPKFMDTAVLDMMIHLPKVCKAFHVPMQSGSDRILTRMKRGYTAETFLDRIDRLRHSLVDCALSTDVMVGFPGETEDDFIATRDVMEKAGFDMAYVFKYSPRPGTEAAAWEDDVAPAVKEERNHLLLDDLNVRSRRLNRQFIGREVEVLVEGPSSRNPDRWMGRSRLNKVCLFEPGGEMNAAVGSILQMKVDEATASALYGRIFSAVTV